MLREGNDPLDGHT